MLHDIVMKDTMVSYKKQELFILREDLCSLGILLVGFVLFLFLVFCVVFVDLFVFALFLMLSVSLHCHCWLPFGFLNVCLTTYKFEQSLHFDTPTTPTKEEILYKHMYVCCSVGMWTKDEELDLPSLLDSKITQLSYILLGLPYDPRNLFPNH